MTASHVDRPRGRSVALLIGVATVQRLPHLAGVADGMRRISRWALAQGFEVLTHDDRDGPVRAEAVADTVAHLVGGRDVGRLFVFFHGHGLAKGTGDDVWLLSRADTRGGEAVDVTRSVGMARRCGIPHVGFFGDACRVPRPAEWLHVQGQSIFPPERVTGTHVEVDQFYATVSGDPAYEVAGDEAETAFGVFTRCLAAALEGEEPDALTADDDGRYVVQARNLRDVLVERVPEVSDIEVGHVQVPDCIPGSYWKPNALSWVSRTTRGPGTKGAPPSPGGAAPPVPPRPRAWRVGDEAELARRFGAAPAVHRHALGTVDLRRRETWLVVEGGAVREALGRVLVDRGPAGELVVETDGPAPALLRIGHPDGDCWVATLFRPPAWQRIVLGRDGADHIHLGAGPETGDDVRSATGGAVLAAALRIGRTEALDAAPVRELLQRGDLTVSLLAGYAFQRRGDDDAVAAIVDRFANGRGPVPYDLALLAGRVDELADRLVPAFPLMTRGWSLADDLPSGLRRELLPVPWTTFSGEVAGDVLAPLVSAPRQGGVW